MIERPNHSSRTYVIWRDISWGVISMYVQNVTAVPVTYRSVPVHFEYNGEGQSIDAGVEATELF